MILLSRTNEEVLDYYTKSGRFVAAFKFNVVRKKSSKIHEDVSNHNVRVSLHSVDSIQDEESDINVSDQFLLDNWYDIAPEIKLRLQPGPDSYHPRVSIVHELDSDIVAVRRELLVDIGIQNFEFGRFG